MACQKGKGTDKARNRLKAFLQKYYRKKLYRLVQQAKRGEKPKAKVDECYNGWRNHAAKGNSTKLLRRMDKYYKDLWKGEA